MIERRARPGLETSTHNSGVIHAGLYYPPGSLKARSVRRGPRATVSRFAPRPSVPHVQVRQAGRRARGGRGCARARARGRRRPTASRVTHVDRAFVHAREPHVAAAEALWSPETGWLEAERVRARARSAARRPRRRRPERHDGRRRSNREPDGAPTVVTPHERIEAEAIVNAAGSACRRGLTAGGRRGVPDFSVSRRIRRARAEGAAPGARSRLSRAAGVGPRPRRAPHANAGRRGLDRADDPLSGGRGDYENNRLPLEAFWSRRGRCCRPSRSMT